MKISGDNRIHHFDSITYKSRLTGKFSEAAVKQNRDSVSIGSSEALQSDKLIAGEAAQKVIREVRTPTSQDKIERLKQQVADGTYQPDAEKIAARMLLEKGIAYNE